MQMRNIRVRVRTYGKAPVRYGRNAYKVSRRDRALLVLAGWAHAGSGRWYEYVIPPEGVRGCDPMVDVRVPTDDEVLSVALQMHKERKGCAQEIEGLIALYQPAHQSEFQVTEFTPGHWGERKEPGVLQHNAYFSFGGASWSIDLAWDQGDDQPPTWHQHESNVLTT